MNTPITFFIPGIPAPGGSKRFVGFGKKTGRAILIDAAGERNKNWRSVCAMIAAQEMTGKEMLRTPLSVHFAFFMPRPKGHYGTKGLKQNAPQRPFTRPDVLKLSRSTEDALTGIVWADDSQTVHMNIAKYFADNNNCGCHVSIAEL